MRTRRFCTAGSRRFWLWLAMAWLLWATAAPAGASSILSREVLWPFIKEMAVKHGFNREALAGLFGQIHPRPEVIAAITRPAEAKPWDEYRALLVTPRRIQGGVAFWEAHASLLAQATAAFGVPSEIIVAILGVESHYGRNSGSHPVLESLATLAFGYPPRGAFFRQELEEYLLLTREEGLDPLALRGSYAGAMGPGQFISSSYRRFAVDFDGDGRRDLLRNIRDVIGSVANYLHAHGWRAGEVVVRPAPGSGEGDQAGPGGGFDSCLPSPVAREGAPGGGESSEPPFRALIALDTKAGPEYWTVGPNFCVITQYNRSLLYAMAVYQLSQRILTARRSTETSQQ